MRWGFALKDGCSYASLGPFEHISVRLARHSLPQKFALISPVHAPVSEVQTTSMFGSLAPAKTPKKNGSFREDAKIVTTGSFDAAPRLLRERRRAVLFLGLLPGW